MISIISCSVDDHRFDLLAETVSQTFTIEPAELIRVRDARSLAEGYNRAIASAVGETIIFCHDDIEILSPDFATRLRQHLQHNDIVGIAGTTRLIGPEWIGAGPLHIVGQVAEPNLSGGYAVRLFGLPRRGVPTIQALDGCFLAVRREVLQKVRFDEKTFDGFHHYDIDFTYAAYLAGFRLAVACDLFLLHHSVGNLAETWRLYAERFVHKYHAQLPRCQQRKFGIAAIYTQRKEELAEIMEEVRQAAELQV